MLGIVSLVVIVFKELFEPECLLVLLFDPLLFLLLQFLVLAKLLPFATLPVAQSLLKTQRTKAR